MVEDRAYYLSLGETVLSSCPIFIRVWSGLPRVLAPFFLGYVLGRSHQDGLFRGYPFDTARATEKDSVQVMQLKKAVHSAPIKQIHPGYWRTRMNTRRESVFQEVVCLFIRPKYSGAVSIRDKEQENGLLMQINIQMDYRDAY